MAKVFFSYSHDDEQYRDQLEKHLAALQHGGLIESWHDRRIVAGSKLLEEIDDQINTADVILLLISSSFLASRYCYTIEMTRALERNAANEASVVPVIVRDCDWLSTPLRGLMAVPKDGRAITSWPNYDEAYANVAREIRRLVEARNMTKTGSPAASRPGTAPAETTPKNAPLPVTESSTRSSNMRLRKSFTALDKENFLYESFEFIARFFEASLKELEARHDGVQGQFRRIDGNTFTAAVYRQGNRSAECAVRIGGTFGQSITYSNRASSENNGFNEMVSVEDDDQAIFFKALGMSTYGKPTALTQSGAAELFWGNLMAPLQR